MRGKRTHYSKRRNLLSLRLYTSFVIYVRLSSHIQLGDINRETYIERHTSRDEHERGYARGGLGDGMRRNIRSDSHNATHKRRPPDRRKEGYAWSGLGYNTRGMTEKHQSDLPTQGSYMEVGYKEGFYTRRGLKAHMETVYTRRNRHGP